MRSRRPAAIFRPWPLWLAFAALIVAILYLSLRACGLVLPGYGSLHRIAWTFCTKAGIDDSLREEERGLLLSDMAAQMQLAIAKAQVSCLASLPPVRPQTVQRCEPSAPPARLVMIFDTSRSMGLPTEDPAAMEELERRIYAGDREAVRLFDALVQAPGRKRFDNAREAALEIVSALPAKLEMGLVSFAGCDVRTDVMPTLSREAATAALQRLSADGATPISKSLRAVRGLMRGAPAIESVVVITDGQESCRGDPCAEARELHNALPNLAIHIIDVTGASRLQCVAEVTGGSITTATNVGALKDAIKRTQVTIDAQANCLPAGPSVSPPVERR